MNLPASLIQTIQGTFGERGRLFLDCLPEQLAEAARRWQLTNIELVPNLSYNFVAFARRLDADVVLKVGVPDPELTSEMTALRLFNGRGCVRLLEADAARGMCLLERLNPGEMLVTLMDDEQATHIAADVMLALWRPAPAESAFIQLSHWLKGLEKLRLRFDGLTGPLPPHLVERAETAMREFGAETYAPTLIHGDLHHFNILSSNRGWLAIDPRGVIGPAAYEVGPLLINPWTVSGTRPETSRLTETRIVILSERLGFERQRIREWGIVHAVLSAWWSLEENSNWQHAMDCAALIAASG